MLQGMYIAQEKSLAASLPFQIDSTLDNKLYTQSENMKARIASKLCFYPSNPETHSREIGNFLA